MLPSVDFLPYFGWFVASIFLLYSACSVFMCVSWCCQSMQERTGGRDVDSVNDLDGNILNITEAKAMTIHEFSKLVARDETGKKQVSIAQIKEILKVTNRLLGGELYKIIKRS